ncbi:hypothetical protein RJO15_11740 [Herbaspirillum huttiense F1]|jgi:hypothetical protein|uniref:Uncharacterized protein n=1 Tax=Herbaspirillum huttiense subsp. lycopersici TaxID=3074428 RepID=A0ABU2EQW4_9BURK|nr:MULTISPECIES: hypothetical protein [Herbaspirillum]MBP1316650.1 hypothetical protein [Herbaspirillum sp. 1130]MCO4855574.1 hypothetical protein [Herbaspirillum sp. WGmk3]MDR6739944.1 hypothetical protein [Herbaspirillum sp. 1173]MDR9850555.1 hypothetical protein [Herbaspirillum huttiense SE1]MDT0356447.1 hypothetical protein [Herbaspirillum huttiense F1]
MSTSQTFSFKYRGYDVTVIGYEIDGGWRMAVELRNGSDIELIRDTATVYPDFQSMRSIAIWTAHLKISRIPSE